MRGFYRRLVSIHPNKTLSMGAHSNTTHHPLFRLMELPLPLPMLFYLLLCCCASFRPLCSAPLSITEEAIQLPPSSSSSSSLSPRLFVFGASMVDSGTNAFAMPRRSSAECEPYGSDYFGRPVGRWSNGRTFMDIITQSLGFGFLDPFIKSVGSDFRHGINFACSGSTAQNTSSVGLNSGGLFSLLVQVEQFREWRNIDLSRQQGSSAKNMQRKQLSNSVYFIETAHNDYSEAGLDSNHVELVKNVIAYMRRAFEVLYSLGARTFIVMNVTPLGCTPDKLSETLALMKDEINCTIAWNDLVRMHNENLARLLSVLRLTYPSAQWILFDAYRAFLDGYQNPSSYGILYPHRACCGAGGPYNYNSAVECGEAGKYINGTYVEAEKCSDPSSHLIWDSIHPTESFGKHVARAVLSGTHLIPHFDITTIRVRNIQLVEAYDRLDST